MGLVAVLLGMVIVGMTTVPLTKWYLSLQDSTIKTEERMEAQSYAFNEWQLVLAEDYGNVTSKSRKTVSDKFDLIREVGAEKVVSTNGREKDVTITVYRTGTNEIAYALASAKAKPTLDEYFTKAQINTLLAERDNKINANTTKINNEATARINKDNEILKRLNGNEFVKNRTSNYNMNFRYEKKSGEDKASIHAYIDNTEIPLGGGEDNHYVVESYYGTNTWYRVYSDGWIEQGGAVIYDWGQDNQVKFTKPFKKKIVTFLFGSNIQWPSAHIPRAYASDLIGFKMGMDAWDATGRYASGIVYHYYATGF